MRDRASFQPYYMQSYYYAELLMLDAGGRFDKSFAASRNGSLADGHLHYSTGQYVSALQDQIAYASGKMLHRDDDGERVLPYRIKPEYQGKTLPLSRRHSRPLPSRKHLRQLAGIRERAGCRPDIRAPGLPLELDDVGL